MVQKTPLKGKVVAITRPAGQTEDVGEMIRTKGGVPYYIPAIEIRPLCNPELVRKFIDELQGGTVDCVILMSTNGVKFLFQAAKEARLTRQLREGLKKTFVIGVGPKTAEALRETGVRVDLVPQKYSSEGLLEVLKERDVKDKRIRIPRTSNATPTLTDTLKHMGADVEEIYVYESGLPMDETLKTKFYQDLSCGRIDAIVFGSGLSARNIFNMLIEKAPIEQVRKFIAEKVTTVAIGPTTAGALKALDVPVDVMPQNYLFEEALEALAKFWAKK